MNLQSISPITSSPEGATKNLKPTVASENILLLTWSAFLLFVH